MLGRTQVQPTGRDTQIPNGLHKISFSFKKKEVRKLISLFCSNHKADSPGPRW